MATPTELEPAQTKLDHAERDYRAGGWAINALAEKYHIPETTLRRYAKKNGWVKGSSGIKRELVREAMAGVPLATGGVDGERVANDVANGAIRQMRLEAATQDVDDMNLGLTVARRCMAALLVMCDQVEQPKDIKLIVESNKLAVETIRKIRSLDADDAPEATVTVDIGDGFAELRAAFKRRLEGTAPPAVDEDEAE